MQAECKAVADIDKRRYVEELNKWRQEHPEAVEAVKARVTSKRGVNGYVLFMKDFQYVLGNLPVGPPPPAPHTCTGAWPAGPCLLLHWGFSRPRLWRPPISALAAGEEPASIREVVQHSSHGVGYRSMDVVHISSAPDGL